MRRSLFAIIIVLPLASYLIAEGQQASKQQAQIKTALPSPKTTPRRSPCPSQAKKPSTTVAAGTC